MEIRPREEMNPFRAAFLAAAFLELASYLTWFFPGLGPAFLITAALLAFSRAFRNLRTLAMVVVLEMVIGGHGHLFWAELGGFRLTLRMVLFAALVAGWLYKRRRDLPVIFLRSENNDRWGFSGLYAGLTVMAMAVVWGLTRGLMEGRGFGEVFSDGNGYAFLLLIPIFLDLFPAKDAVRALSKVFAGGLLWLSVKSLTLLYFFSHWSGTDYFLTDLYLWQRRFWLTEITLSGGFIRVFSASDVFLILGVFGAASLIAVRARRRKIWAWTAIVGAALLLSMSRSFWLGALVAALFVLPLLLSVSRPTFRRASGFIGKGLVAVALSLTVLVGIARFPIPAPVTESSGISNLGDRLTDASDAAVSSRWNLLGPLVTGIARHPVLGSGFGATVTYQSDDPRIHALYEGGVIETSAIEWQYLEIWYKMGVFGLIAVIVLISLIGVRLVRACLRAEGEDRGTVFVLLAGFIAFVVANVFTPYINHPLGWMYLALLLVGARSSLPEFQPSVAPTKSG